MVEIMDDFAGKDNDDIPWGKYTYSLEGLAKECYLEGAVNVDLAHRPGAPAGKRLRFRVELPERCFILSIAIKLPNAPEVALKALEDVCIERTLRSAEYEMIHDGVLSTPVVPPQVLDGDSPTAVDATAQSTPHNHRKKVLEIRRAADSLRITLADIDPPPNDDKMRDVTDSESDSDGHKTGEIRKLGVTVVGYVRGQTPVASRIKILLASSTRLGASGSLADRAEIDGLLGLAFLGNKRYRQAGELLERASNGTRQVAIADQKKGFAGELGFTWAAELNLLAAHAYFEHEPRANDGIARLVAVVTTTKPRASTTVVDIAPRNEPSEFLDLRTELLRITQPLMEKLVEFLGESSSLAVQMASARMIEFVGQQLGCAIAPYIGKVLDQVLSAYPECKPLGARERAAAASFSYDSMEDCYEKLVDICCRLLPLTEHSVLQRILEHTLMPVLHEAFDETKYLVDSDNVEDEADDLLCTAVSQTLRLIYLVLTILGGDANVPPSFITKLLDMLIADDGRSRTPMLLRRSALHTWDAMTKSVIQSSNKKSVKDFKEYITVQVSYLSVMVVMRRRRPFEYQDGEDSEAGYEVRSLRMKKSMELSKALKSQLEKQKERVVIADRHTLRRLLSFMTETFVVLVPMSDDDERHTASTAVSRLLRVLNESAADLFLSTLMDISYFTAVSCNVGPSSNLDYIEYGTFSSHMKACLEIFECLLDCYWAAIRLLPSKIAEETEKKFLVRSLLSWCVLKMRESAPPRDMLRLILLVVRGFQSESSCTFKQDYDFPVEVSPLDLFRANNLWLAHATYFEALDLFDVLCPLVGRHLMAKDILDAINGLGEQDDILDGRAYLSADVLAIVVAQTIPADPDATKRSLAEVVDHTVDEPRIVDGFPKTSSSNRGSMIPRKLRFASTQAADNDPMIGSLYIHIVLASCFDKFDSLDKAGKRKGGGLCMGNYLDSFIEHAAFLVKCLVQCAKERKHREYIRHALGEIFRSCLNMQNHGDGRVRLAGFEIFASSLNVLFLTESSGQRTDSTVNETLALGTTMERTSSISLMASVTAVSDPSLGSVKELGPTADINVEPKSPSAAPNGKIADSSEANKAASNETNQSADDDEKMYEIYTNGGSCTFYASQSSSSDLTFEENAWHMLSTFMTSSLGVGKYADFVVHRACLEYLRGCILNALRGKSTGASVISFLHVDYIWEAVLRLVGSPVHSLNGLALWVICATINVGVYSAVMAKGRGESRQRASALAEFVTNKLFVTAENFIKGGSKEMRLWGGRILEVYIRARSMNTHSLDICPPPSRKVLLALQALSSDWCEEARVLAKSLLSMHLEIPTKKPTTPSSSFTDRASTFLTNRRFGGNSEQEDIEPNNNSDSIELWFPALPTVSSIAQMDRFGKTLEAFANAEVVGGEEADIIDSEDDREESEYEEESVNYEEEEEVEYGIDDNFVRSNSVDGDDGSEPEEIIQEAQEEEVEEEGSDEEGDGEFAEPQPEEKTEQLPETQVETSNDNVVPMDMEIVQAPEPKEVKKPAESAEQQKPKNEPFVSPQPKEQEKSKTEKTEKPKSEKAKPEKTKAEKSKSEKSKSEKATHVSPGEKTPKKSMPTFPGDVIEGVENDDLELEEIDDLDDLGLGGLGATVVEDHEEEEIDLDDTGLERMPSLPRVGSFTGRKPQAVNAEGEGIRLERRKSMDVGSLWESNASRKRSDEDYDVNSRNRRSAFREVSSMNDDKAFGSGREVMQGSNSFKGGRGSPKEVASQPGLLGLSSSRRVQRGVKLDDEEEMPTRQQQSGSSSGRPNIEELRRKFDNPSSRSSSSQQSQAKVQSSSRRALPRVPAFNKVQTRRAGNQADKGGLETHPQADSGSSLGSRLRLPRGRSSTKTSQDAGRRGDRDRLQRSQSDLDGDGSSPQVYISRTASADSRRRARRLGSDEFLPKDTSKDKDESR